MANLCCSIETKPKSLSEGGQLNHARTYLIKGGKMSSTIHRTPKPGGGRQSLFFHDLASPVSTRNNRSGSAKFSTPGQAAAVSALWRENFATSDLPPPPIFTLEDRSDFSPESGIADYPPLSPDSNSNPRTPAQNFSTPKKKSEASTSYALFGKQQQHQQSWWSPGKSGGGSGEVIGEDKGKGSPVEGVVQPGALITLPPPREVARPELQRNTSVPVGTLDEEEWVTVYGFSPGDTNLVLQEFEKCGLVLKHVPGPRDANWIHILYQSQSDAQKALSKNGLQINGALIIGVKPVDPMQRQALSGRLNNQGFMPLPPPPSSKSSEPMSFKASDRPYYLQNGGTNARQSGGTMASPAKSVVSKIMDLMFGV